MSKRATYFVASEMADFCGVDLKTIHNWANRGKLPHFRTPGRHLRFQPAAVKAFLEAQGFDVPAAVADAQPLMLNVQNGTIDLETGTLREPAA